MTMPKRPNPAAPRMDWSEGLRPSPSAPCQNPEMGWGTAHFAAHFRKSDFFQKTP